MKSKQVARQRRAAKTRRQISKLSKPRLCVYRSGNHIYAQVTSATGDRVLASSSTLDKQLRPEAQTKTGIEAASLVGKTIAERALIAGIKSIAFDRSGYKYHGRVKSLADAARKGGLEF